MNNDINHHYLSLFSTSNTKKKKNNIIMMPASSHLVTTISEKCQLKFLKMLSKIYHKFLDHKDCH